MDQDRNRTKFSFASDGEDPVIDLFGDEDTDTDIAAVSDTDEPEQGSEASQEESQFSFDRYGRRIDRRKKTGSRSASQPYGKRKDAPKASTRVVRRETDAERAYRAAQERSAIRADHRRRVEEKERKEQQKQRRERAKTRWSTVLMGVLAAGILLGMGWFTTRLRTVRFQPIPEGYTEESLLELSGIELGKSIVFQSMAEAEQRLETDAYLEASVRYAFPSTVQVTLKKRTAVACVRWGPQNEYLALVDENGIVVEAEAESSEGLLVAEGLSITNAAEGKRLGDLSDAQVASLIDLLSKMKEQGLLERSPKPQRIDLSELMSVSIYTADKPYRIEVGDMNNLTTKLMLLNKHWDEIMSRADRYLRNGYDTATVYLYSKDGITISPYEPGYDSMADSVIDYGMTTDAPTTPPPEQSVTPDPNGGDPAAATEPPTTPMPNQNDPFTG